MLYLLHNDDYMNVSFRFVLLNLLSVFLITSNVYCQNIEKGLISKIDSLVSLIPDGMDKSRGVFICQSSGFIHKKKFLSSKKNIGSFSESCLYKDTTILLVQSFSSIKKRRKSESYYYDEGTLIKFIKETRKSEKAKTVVITIYFNENKVVGGTNYKKENINSIIEEATFKKKQYKDMIENFNYRGL